MCKDVTWGKGDLHRHQTGSRLQPARGPKCTGKDSGVDSQSAGPSRTLQKAWRAPHQRFRLAQSFRAGQPDKSDSLPPAAPRHAGVQRGRAAEPGSHTSSLPPTEATLTASRVKDRAAGKAASLAAQPTSTPQLIVSSIKAHTGLRAFHRHDSQLAMVPAQGYAFASGSHAQSIDQDGRLRLVAPSSSNQHSCRSTVWRAASPHQAGKPPPAVPVNPSQFCRPLLAVNRRILPAPSQLSRQLWQVNSLAGALAGATVTTCLHPVDTLKVLLQSNHGANRSMPSVLSAAMRQRGLRSLCAGSLTAAATAAPISALFAVTYEATKARLAPRLPKDRQWVAQCLAGASASVATSFVYTPSECIKAQLQVGQYRCAVRAGLDLVRQHGVQRLYHGWTAVLCRNVPQSMAKFLVYEQLRMRVCRTVNKEEMSPGATMLCGSIAGSAAACLTTPFDVVKTRMQLHGTASLAGSTSAASMHSTASVASTMRSIVRQEGLQGLYCGLAPRLLIYMTQGAIYFCAYELLRKALHTEAEQWRQGHRLGLQAMHTDMGQWQQGHAPPYSTKLHGTG